MLQTLTMQVNGKFLGKDLVYTYEINRYIPGEILIMSTANGTFPMMSSSMRKANKKDLLQIKNILEN